MREILYLRLVLPASCYLSVTAGTQDNLQARAQKGCHHKVLPNLKMVNILLFSAFNSALTIFVTLSISILISLYESISPLEVDSTEAAPIPFSLP